MDNKGEIIIYQTADKQTQIEVRFEAETVWLSQQQMAQLFRQTKQNISLHINNIYKEKELSKKATVKKTLTVQQEGTRKITRQIDFYNLDVIISAGYRVKSVRGTQFRQWVTQRLKEHLIRGYSINQQRLAQLQQTIQLIHKTGSTTELNEGEAKGLLDIINNYTQSFILLNQFDSHKLQEEKLSENITYGIEYHDAVDAVDELRKQLIKKREASALFGNQKDQGFAGMLKSIVQTFDGQYLYPSIEEQAAHLLYFIKESSIHRWQQAYWCIPVCLVP
ncbi:MAG TPA: RhuM family protein [Parafilimonas sp.]|nr:RhuM family protein [Parafilimonas sp.]